MKKIINNIFSGATMLALAVGSIGALSLAGSTPTFAQSCDTSQLTLSGGVACGQPEETPTELFEGSDSIFSQITNVMLFIIGAISVIMLIVGGVRYTISNGDQGAVQSAKNTIMYAIIGLIVAILAFAVVKFVTGSFLNN